MEVKMSCPTRFVVDSMEAAIKELEWSKCAAPRLVYDSALFFETCMHVYVRTTYDQMYPAKIKTPPGGKVSGWTYI